MYHILYLEKGDHAQTHIQFCSEAVFIYTDHLQVFDLAAALDGAGEWLRPLEITLIHRPEISMHTFIYERGTTTVKDTDTDTEIN